jgi:hypothetical protein
VRLALLFLVLCLPAHAQDTLPDAPKPKPQHSRKVFWIGVTALATAETFDSVETRRGLNVGGSEANPFFGPHPGIARQSLTAAGLFAAEATVFHFTERSRHWYIRWPGRVGLGYVVVIHVRAGFGDAAFVRRYSR